MTYISRLRQRQLTTRGATTRSKILFVLLVCLRGLIFMNKNTFTPKCLRLKRLARTRRWSQGEASFTRRQSQGEASLRTMGLGQEGVGSPGSGFLNLQMRNISLTGVERQHILYRDHSIWLRLCFFDTEHNQVLMSVWRKSLRALGLELEVETEGGDPPLSTVVAPD